MWTRAFLLKWTMLGWAVLNSAVVVMACPNCKYAVEQNPAEPRAYMYSILFMLGMIGGVFSLMTGLLWWVNRMERQSLEQAGYQHLFENGVTAQGGR